MIKFASILLLNVLYVPRTDCLYISMYLTERNKYVLSGNGSHDTRVRVPGSYVGIRMHTRDLTTEVVI